jgi:hypothetical protein
MAIQRRRRAGLPTAALSVWALKVAGLAAIVIVAVFLLSQERQRAGAPIVIQGVPWVVPLVTALVVALSFLLMRTGFGRHVYAVGGNAEAARRHQRRRRQDLLLHPRVDAGDRRGHPARVAGQLGLTDDRRRADAALRGRCGRDRRHVAVRRPRARL